MPINFARVPHYIRREIDPPGQTLRRGSRGVAVKRVQEWLCYHQCRTSIDGKFGPATADCVGSFQDRAGLGVSGEVTANTWLSLVAPMNTVLAEPLPADSLADTVAATATQHEAQHPHEIGGPNCGPWVRLYCGGQDGPDWAWCAGFVSFLLQQACFYRDEPLPITGSVSCDTLAAQAKTAQRFVTGRSIARGESQWQDLGGSAIFLKRRTATDWVHAGIAIAASGSREALVFHNVEGNTNDEGSREGHEACRRTRCLGPGDYDFIRLSADT